MRTRLHRLFAVLAIAAAILAVASAPQQADPERYLGDVRTLASPDMWEFLATDTRG